MLDPDKFKINFVDEEITITRHNFGIQPVFRVVFPNTKPPLVLTRTQSPTQKFWTSIPEGRQKEAEQIGELITAYFKTLE